MQCRIPKIFHCMKFDFEPQEATSFIRGTNLQKRFKRLNIFLAHSLISISGCEKYKVRT